MGLFFEIVEGVRKGTRYKIRDGVQLGRKDGDIVLRDPKISKLHATVEVSNKGEVFLVDNGSSNGIKVKGKKHRRVRLKPNLVFQLGNTTLRVIGKDKPVAGSPDILKKSSWRENLIRLAFKAAKKSSGPETSMKAFDPPVELAFVKGPLADTRWRLEYGPRTIGSASLEFPVFDPEVSAASFCLTPTQDGVHFGTKDTIEVNGKKESSIGLKTGDTLNFGWTEIIVSWDENENN